MTAAKARMRRFATGIVFLQMAIRAFLPLKNALEGEVKKQLTWTAKTPERGGTTMLRNAATASGQRRYIAGEHGSRLSIGWRKKLANTSTKRILRPFERPSLAPLVDGGNISLGRLSGHER
jgi:hypothetical protein